MDLKWIETRAEFKEAERLAWLVLGSEWEALSLVLGLDPFLATSDDVLGDFEERFRTGAGDRVLLEGELHSGVDSGSPNSPLEEADWLYAEPGTEYEVEVTSVQEVAGLTRREAEVVEFIMSGVPLSSGYAVFVGSILGMRPATVREHWRTARKKLQNHWSG